MARHDPERYLPNDPEWQRINSLTGMDRLETYVHRLNNNRWVVESGNPYFINSRTKPNGKIEHFVDRPA